MYVVCLVMYCFHHNLLPEVFDHYFTLNRNVHAYDTRQRQLSNVLKCPSNPTKRGVKYQNLESTSWTRNRY